MSEMSEHSSSLVIPGRARNARTNPESLSVTLISSFRVRVREGAPAPRNDEF
jgi:hypothetical protein